jgi:hypothetical protein
MFGQQTAHLTDDLLIGVLRVSDEGFPARHDRGPHLFETFNSIYEFSMIQVIEPMP